MTDNYPTWLVDFAVQVNSLIADAPTMARFREMVRAWEDEVTRESLAHADWLKRRRAHEKKVLADTNKYCEGVKRPSRSWQLDWYSHQVTKTIHAWTPPNLLEENRPADKDARLHWHEQRAIHFRDTAQSEPSPQDEQTPPPHPEWKWAAYSWKEQKDFQAWTPSELCSDSEPKQSSLLPLDGSRKTIAAKYALLAAVHDAYYEGNAENVNPWPSEDTSFNDEDGPAFQAAILSSEGAAYHGLLYRLKYKASYMLAQKGSAILDAFLGVVRADLETAAKEVGRGREQENRERQEPLSENAAAVYELLQALPPHKAMTGRDILTALETQKNIITDQSTITKSIIPALRPYGVKNKRGAGYYIGKK